MVGLGILLLVIYLVAKFVGVVVENLLDIAVFIIIVGVVVDVVLAFLGKSVYRRWR